jgi:hypothetical protein
VPPAQAARVPTPTPKPAQLHCDFAEILRVARNALRKANGRERRKVFVTAQAHAVPLASGGGSIPRAALPHAVLATAVPSEATLPPFPPSSLPTPSPCLVPDNVELYDVMAPVEESASSTTTDRPRDAFYIPRPHLLMGWAGTQELYDPMDDACTSSSAGDNNSPLQRGGNRIHVPRVAHRAEAGNNPTGVESGGPSTSTQHVRHGRHQESAIKPAGGLDRRHPAERRDPATKPSGGASHRRPAAQHREPANTTTGGVEWDIDTTSALGVPELIDDQRQVNANANSPNPAGGGIELLHRTGMGIGSVIGRAGHSPNPPGGGLDQQRHGGSRKATPPTRYFGSCFFPLDNECKPKHTHTHHPTLRVPTPL